MSGEWIEPASDDGDGSPMIGDPYLEERPDVLADERQHLFLPSVRPVVE